MPTIYLSLSAQVAKSTFFMKSLVVKRTSQEKLNLSIYQFCSDGIYLHPAILDSVLSIYLESLTTAYI